MLKQPDCEKISYNDTQRVGMSPKYTFNFENSEFIDVDIEAAGFQTTVVPVLFREKKTEVSAQGTAFCIAAFANGEAIFATATHVIQQLDGAKDIEPFVLLPRDLGTPAGRKDLRGVRVHQISLAGSYSDVALLVVNIQQSEIPVTQRLKILPLTLNIPRQRENCMAVGYPQNRGALSYQLTASRGTIEEIHPTQRDRALSTFPSFRTTASYLPGMSGGPIIDTNGYVVGIVSHGTDATDHSAVTGYGACVAALTELRLDLHDDSEQLREFTFNELVAMKAFRIEESTVILSRREDGVTLSWNGTPNDDSTRE